MRRKAAGLALMAAIMLSGCLTIEDEELDSIVIHTREAAGETEMIGTDGEDYTVSEEMTQEQTAEESAQEETAQKRTTEAETTAKAQSEAYQVFSLGRTLSENRRQINTGTMNEPASHVVELFSMTFTAAEVKTLIEQYAFPDYAWLSGRMLTADDRIRIEENRNLSVLSGQEGADISYGILMENAAVRSFPADERLTAAAGNTGANFDYFQESLLFMGEPVALLHTSLDGRFTFVQGLNYSGWIRTECIQLCDALLAQTVMQCADFAVITDNFCEINGRDNRKLLRMGTALPLLGETEESYILSVFCQKEEADGCFAFLDGELRYYKAADAPQDTQVLWTCEKAVSKKAAHHGYMEFTADNVLLLSGHMLGNRYSWGDEDAGYDCSSTVGSIYRCFGIILPRNSGILKYTGADVTDLTDMTVAEKRAYITALPIGTLLVLPGHVMMYIGEQNISISGQEQRVPAMLHCVTGYVDEDNVKVEPYACVITSIDIRTRGIESYLELMNTCISFQLEQPEER